MFAPCLLVFTCLATSRGQSVFSGQDQWTGLDDSSQYYDAYGSSVGADLWPETPTGVMEGVSVSTQSSSNSAEPPHMATRDSSEAVGESAVWKTALVVAVLLVCVVGCVSVAYYLCVWRGGRFYYQPQKEADP